MWSCRISAWIRFTATGSHGRAHQPLSAGIVPAMHRSLQLPEIFSCISLASIAAEAALAQWSLVRATYRVKDTLASLGMQAGNIVMNLGMAGFVYAGLTAAHGHRLFDLPASSRLGLGRALRARRLHLLLVPSHQPRMPLLVGGARQSSFLAGIQSLDRRSGNPGPASSSAPGPRGSRSPSSDSRRR